MATSTKATGSEVSLTPDHEARHCKGHHSSYRDRVGPCTPGSERPGRGSAGRGTPAEGCCRGGVCSACPSHRSLCRGSRAARRPSSPPLEGHTHGAESQWSTRLAHLMNAFRLAALQTGHLLVSPYKIVLIVSLTANNKYELNESSDHLIFWIS